MEFSKRLPKAYIDFLLSEDIAFLVGTDYIGDFTEEATLLLEENNLRLPINAYVFTMHQGYSFNFFLLTEEENPPVYSYCEGQQIKQTYSTFTEFVQTELEYYNKLRLK